MHLIEGVGGWCGILNFGGNGVVVERFEGGPCKKGWVKGRVIGLKVIITAGCFAIGVKK